MYELFKSVIMSKQYELTDMIKKIDVKWISGELTEEQRTELITMAQNNASMSNSIDIMSKLMDLDRRVKSVEDKVFTLDSESGETVTNVEEYIPGKYYYANDEVLHKENIYVCIAPEGVVCVWSPTEYPPYWELKQR